MAFVRTKQVGGKTYYQLVKNERVAGKHKQLVLMHLGHHATVEVAMAAWAERARTDRAFAEHDRKQGRVDLAHKRDERASSLEEKVERLRFLSGA